MQSISLRQFCLRVYFVDADDLARRTQQFFMHALNRWERTTGDPPISEITDNTLREWREGAKDLSPATVKSHWNAISVLLHHAKRRGLIDLVPYLRLSRQQPPLRHVPTPAALGRAYTAAGVAVWPRLHVSTETFWKSFLVVSYFTGLRLSDMMHNLRWSGVHDDRIEVVAQKTNKLHVFPMHPILRTHLDLIRPPADAALEDDRVFPVSRSPHLVRRELKRISRAAGIGTLTPHGLRRLAGTEWEAARDGAGQMLLGHSLGVSDRYIAVPRILRRAIKRLRVPAEFSS